MRHHPTTVACLAAAALAALLAATTSTPAGATTTNPPITRVIAAAQDWVVPMDGNGQTILDPDDVLGGWSPYDVVGIWVNPETGADTCKATPPLTPDGHVKVTCFDIHNDGTVDRAANQHVEFNWLTVVATNGEPQ